MTTETFTTGTAPGAWPLIGHAVPLMRNPWDFLTTLSEHGDLVELKVGPERIYVASNPDLLQYVLTHDRVFDKGGIVFETARSILGNGLLVSQHSHHRRARRLMQPAFHRDQLAHYNTGMEHEITKLVESFKPGQVIDGYRTFYRVTLRMLIRSLFSIEPEDSTVETIEHNLELIMSGVAQRMFMPDRLLRLPTPGNRRYEEAMRKVHGEVDNLIKNCRRNSTDENSLFSLMTSARDSEGKGFTEQEIHDEVLNTLHAGSETTAMGLTWALYRLTAHPEVQRRLQEESDSVLAGRPATFADIPQLGFATRIFMETLRIYPPAWAFTRTVTEETELAGTKLKPGTTIVCCSLTTHRHKGLFVRPDEFNPDRWLPGRPDTPPRNALTTFGNGARRCMGDVYAFNEATCTLATLASRWEVSLDPAADIRLTPMSIGIYPRSLLIKLQPREPRPRPAQEQVTVPEAASSEAAQADQPRCPITGQTGQR